MMFSLFPDVNSVAHQSTVVVDGVPGSVCHGREEGAPDLASYLPWNLTEERLKGWSLKEEEEVSTDTS